MCVLVFETINNKQNKKQNKSKCSFGAPHAAFHSTKTRWHAADADWSFIAPTRVPIWIGPNMRATAQT